MNGISANVSRTLSHLDFWRAMSQAIGIPATRSRAETNKAMAKELPIALSALLMRSGWTKTCCIAPHFITTPNIGGSRISTKKTMTAEKYVAYFTGFLEASPFRAFVKSRLTVLLFNLVFPPMRFSLSFGFRRLIPSLLDRILNG